MACRWTCLYKNPTNQLQKIQTPTSRHPSSRTFADLYTWPLHMEPGWLNQDGTHWTIPCLIKTDCAHLHRGNFSVPLSLLIKTPASTESWRWAWRHESPSSRWQAPANKPLSFTTAPASLVLAFEEAGSLCGPVFGYIII